MARASRSCLLSGRGEASGKGEEGGRGGDQKDPGIGEGEFEGHPSFLSSVIARANASASASWLPYHTSSKPRVSAVSVDRCSLAGGSSRRYSRGVRARSGRQTPCASRKEIPHQYVRWTASRQRPSLAADRASASQAAHSCDWRGG